MYSNKTIIMVLSLALLAFAYGHVVIAFIIAITMVLLLADSVCNCINKETTESEDFPTENWLITQKKQNINVCSGSCINDNIMRFMAGKHCCVQLNNTKNNKNPKNVAVEGKWVDISGNIHNAKLGYISRKKLQPLYKKIQSNPKCKISAKPSTIFIPTQRQSFPGLYIDVAILEPATAKA